MAGYFQGIQQMKKLRDKDRETKKNLYVFIIPGNVLYPLPADLLP
jgi:hypothetical protein